MTVGRAPPISDEGGWCGQGAVPIFFYLSELVNKV